MFPITQNQTKINFGFTLVEIVAVLVIIGILAAVAVPRYIDMQYDARRAALQNVARAAQSSLAQEYSRSLLTSDGSLTVAWEGTNLAACENVTRDGWLSDSSITCSKIGTTHISIVVSHVNAAGDATTRFSNPAQ